MKRIMPLFFLLCASLCPAQTNPAPADLDATQAITRLREGLIESFNKGDVDRLLTYLDTNAVVTWQNGEVCRGPEAVRAYSNKMMQGENRIVRDIKSEPEVLGRHVYGDWAVSWGNLHDRITLMDGGELPFNTLFTATVARRGDRWLLTSFHASVNAFNNPVLSMAMRKTGLWAGLGGMVVGILIGGALSRILRRKQPTKTNT
jgi:ketosteroid isomerase-like protein